MSTQLSLLRDTPQLVTAGIRTELMLRKLYRLYALWKSQGKPTR